MLAVHAAETSFQKVASTGKLKAHRYCFLTKIISSTVLYLAHTVFICNLHDYSLIGGYVL